MFAKSALIALFAAVAAAQLHAPTELDTSGGNAITRPLNEAVVAGTPFTITWTHSYENTVSLLLLKGPSSNVQPIGEPIAEGIENTGSFTWTPPAEFGPGLSETTGYGIQIIDDKTGLYQWSTQFGITIPEDYEGSSSAVETKTGGGYSVFPSITATMTASSVIPSITGTVTASSILTSSYPSGTGAPGNHSIIQPSKPLSVPSSLLPSSTNPGENPPESTGAASQLQAGLGLVAGVAGIFFML